jgi:hypothetical protein
VRGGKLRPSQALQSFFEMANTRSPMELLRGIAMLRGWSYRTNRRSNATGSRVAQNKEAVESLK